jgi:hypothetical protein
VDALRELRLGASRSRSTSQCRELTVHVAALLPMRPTPTRRSWCADWSKSAEQPPRPWRPADGPRGTAHRSPRVRGRGLSASACPSGGDASWLSRHSTPT